MELKNKCRNMGTTEQDEQMNKPKVRILRKV